MTVEVNHNTLETSEQGIFAAGDIVTGPASVVEAIAMGRTAASEIDKYLGGDGIIDKTLVAESPESKWTKQEGNRAE